MYKKSNIYKKIVDLFIDSIFLTIPLFSVLGMIFVSFSEKENLETKITQIIYFCTLLVLTGQVYEIRMQRKTDIERRDRETTVNVLSSWLKTFERKAILARYLLSEFNKSNIKKIFNFEKASLPNEKEKREKVLDLLYAIDHGLAEEVEALGEIPSHVSTYLRSLMVEYLNTLEIILLAWDQRIIDENTFKEEFKYLVQGNKCILDDILEVVGRENFPTINKFCQKLIEEQKPDSNPSKEPLK